MPGNAQPQVIIANTLDDGFTVFLTEDHGWTSDIAAAALATEENSAAELLNVAKRAEEDNIILDPYLIEVAEENGERRPVEIREYIRATGPSITLPSDGS